MIQSFKCAQTQELFETGKSRQFANIKQVAERKLTQLAAAVTLEFLKSPPGTDGPADVEIVDYH
jgi:toxin HigB-1